jgi:hypothetical protein
MKEIFFLALVIFFVSTNGYSQDIRNTKKIDSTEIESLIGTNGMGLILAHTFGKTDTIWTGEGYYGPFYDAHFFKGKLIVIALAYPLVYYSLFKWNGKRWELVHNEGLTSITPQDPCQVKIVGDGLVRLEQSGGHTVRTWDSVAKKFKGKLTGQVVLIKYDTETGIELSRTVEK